MPTAVLINGRETTDVPVSERGLQFGDGLFETIAVKAGRACLWQRHLHRLADGAQRLGLPVPDPTLLTSERDRLLAGRGDGVLKLYWTAGMSARGYRRSPSVAATRILQFYFWPELVGEPVRMRLCRTRLARQPQLAGIKHMNRLEQVLARAEWDDPAIAEGLMLDTAGNVIEGTMSNLFMERDGLLYTPDLHRAGITGVVRGLALELGGTDSPVHQPPMTLETLLHADALYLTNSVIGVWRVARLDDHEYDITRREHPLMTRTRTAAFAV